MRTADPSRESAAHSCSGATRSRSGLLVLGRDARELVLEQVAQGGAAAACRARALAGFDLAGLGLVLQRFDRLFAHGCALERESDTTLLGVDGNDLGLDDLAFLHDLARVVHGLVAEFADVDEAFHAALE